jgi:hypothetical protein
MINDGDFTFAVDCLNHGLACQFATRVIVGGYMSNNFGAFIEVGNIGGENRNAGFIGRLNGRADSFGITGAQHNGADHLHYEIVHLLTLAGRIHFAGGDGCLIAFFFTSSCMASPISLKNGFVMVSSETPIVPLEEEPDTPDVEAEEEAEVASLEVTSPVDDVFVCDG